MARPALLACLLAAVAGCHVLSPGYRSDSPFTAEPDSGRSRLAGGTRPDEPGTSLAGFEREGLARQAGPTLLGTSLGLGEREGPARPAGPTEPSAVDDDPLSLAADCLGRGDEAAAADHLARHVAKYPDQVVFRTQLADLLLRLDRLPDARRHFEAAVAQSQEGPPAARKRLVHCHTRLMEIARAREDDYAERLHRGIGLYLVGAQLAADEPGEAERLLCKAAAELKEARARRPDDARAAWYLYRVWTELDQPKPAAKALRQAAAAAPLGDLTPAEARGLAVAARGGEVAR
jgi:tetratricopeptide (TPR) repeat protein